MRPGELPLLPCPLGVVLLEATQDLLEARSNEGGPLLRHEGDEEDEDEATCCRKRRFSSSSWAILLYSCCSRVTGSPCGAVKFKGGGRPRSLKLRGLMLARP